MSFKGVNFLHFLFCNIKYFSILSISKVNSKQFLCLFWNFQFFYNFNLFFG